MFCYICVLCISLNLIPNGVFPGIFRCGDLLTPLRIVKPVEHRAASGLACCNQSLFCTVVGQGVCRRCRNSGDKLVGRIDIDGQRDVLIVRALDHYGHCAHRAGGFHVIFLNRQGQLAVFHLRAAGVVAVIEFDLAQLIGGCTVLFGSFQRGQSGERHSVGLFVAVYNGQRSFLGEVRRSGLGDAASRGEAALLQGVILRGLLHQGHCGSNVLAVAHTGIVKVGGDGVVCASVQGHVVEGHAGDVRVCCAIIGLGRSRYPGDRQRLLPNADRHAGGCGIVVVFIANHPIPHGIRSGIGAGRDDLAVCTVLGQAVLHSAILRHAACGNQRLLLANIGQVFLRYGRRDEACADAGLLYRHSNILAHLLVAVASGQKAEGVLACGQL